MTQAADFGTFGVWRGAALLDAPFARRVEALGYGTLWIGGSPSGDLGIVEELLDATEAIVIATGIVNIWKDDAVTVARSFRRIDEHHPGRFVLGIGSGHREATAERVRPLASLAAYLDVLDAEGVGPDQRLLAALGDRTLALAAERSLGAHPYLTVPAHTRHARAVMDAARPGALLAPEQKIAIADDADAARATARAYLKRYFRLENYVGALVRHGVDESQFEGGGSDDLIDAVASNPTVDAGVAGLRAHLDAGADHVSAQALGDDPLGALELLAESLELPPRR
ncbi:TIGR03620 family F420-dependent LLM class oxidoreductase [Microbacterium album]|uniref:LLM class F420-dependent oxidoreductase n=1 Tax=Microbacterium album TaxID=2053191 RepID=A0A917MMJ1_9MICO|nr:TIGR03620 family F420-dependent LLM class oxidoreductase [Microbacterium album]GGH48645.1 LLM class F420-dependent oxidoreductase [Microbacterium album]